LEKEIRILKQTLLKEKRAHERTQKKLEESIKQREELMLLVDEKV